MTQLDMTASVPVEVSQLAVNQQLGAHRLTLPAAKRLRLIFAAGLFCLIFGGFGVVVALADSSSASASAVGWAFAAVFVFLLGWAVAASPLVSKRARARQFYLYERGFVHPGKKGIEVYRYDGIR